MVHCLVVELTGDVKVEVLLVSLESRFEVFVELIGEIREGIGDVAEVLEVVFELG